MVLGVKTDPQLMAGTILFLASKIEEEPLKLRYICNACLERFDHSPQYSWRPGQQENPVSSTVSNEIYGINLMISLHHHSNIRSGKKIFSQLRKSSSKHCVSIWASNNLGSSSRDPSED
jgi:hypothetical protein